MRIHKGPVGLHICSAVVPLLLLANGVGGPGRAQGCPTPTADGTAKIRTYVAAHYEVAPDLVLEDEGPVKGTCFRVFVARATAPRRTILLYASPDLRFLTESLLDTTIDPASERRRVALETQKALVLDESPSRGNSGASVTVVMFSDFQCPFCKRFEDFIASLPADEMSEVRVVFKHLPLAMHQWARPAAEFAICAGLQEASAFWRLHDFLVANQATLTPALLRDRLEPLANQEDGLDAGKLRECVDKHGADPVLLRDERLAELYHVDATPTIFINGVRSPGVHSAEELDWAVRRAILDAKGRGDPER